MVNAKDVVSHPLRAIDAIGYPFVRVAHSRKVMKGEDKSFASPDVVWTPARVDGDGAEGCSASPPPSSCHFSVFGLFDGHGGKAAAEHCAETLVPCILDALDARGPIARDDDAEDALEERLPAALVDAFAASDAQFLLKDIHSGATATIVCVNGRCVTSAAVGDSLATIDTGSHHQRNSTKSSGGASSASRLTPEHRLDTSASERNRIEAAGGEVRATAFEEGKPVGPLRVWPGGLAVSRSMGDRDGKKGGAFYLTPPGFRIVLASDGLWDAVTVKQASSCGAKIGTQAAAAALCKLAQKQKDNRDDITVVVCDFLADASHRDPFQAKPPWRTELDVRWPFGKKKYDPSPPPSTRRAARMAAERAEADAIAAAREARVAAETEEAARAAARAATVAELERYERERESARDGGGGWEEQQQHGFHDQQQMQQRMQTQYEHHHRTHHQQTHHPQMRQPQMQQHSPQQVAYLAQHHEMAARMRQQHEQQMQQQEMLANLQRQRMAQQGQYSTRGPGPFSFSPPSSSPPPPRPHPHPPSSSNGVARELDAPAAGAGVGAKTKPKRKGKRERAQERARLIAESGGGTS
ncbi:uncharacterized protein MICPUCDRAFT_41863 [Micromonas pusilla CCMP1545]|uniref:protein-serine/threonine phosphatase n=1 Tax=Micromonas pusilla (strain CCMP1545) TaxID=564608 RepID=C1N2Q1_MICPC|nr:uncharacterized protein MICPUCDRAFT_41863 [Micromonas pusilla CCMP1545]EEH53837.1 predicted protein [Micromonas pusilla CCMP1545]|eukprot:XP_003062125.1 predicted protein [Micromonas pusilla CCMP1545]